MEGSARDNHRKRHITSIRTRLEKLTDESVDCCIFAVPDRLRTTHREAFSPKLVSIGPFHHGKDSRAMEEHKWRYLQSFLNQTTKSLEGYVEAIEQLEEKTRNCYSEKIDLNSNEFVTMVLVDGAFIIELFLSNHIPRRRAKNDIIFDTQKPWMISTVRRDMSLMENQLPYFVLENLFELAFQTRLEELPSLLELAYEFLCYVVNLEPKTGEKMIFNSNVKHLLDALRIWCLPTVPKEINEKWEKIEAIAGVKQLKAAGVKFRLSESNCLFDIKFSKGVLEIPCLKLNSSTESFLWNITAFEQFYYKKESYFIDYVAFLGNLINTRAEAKMLIKKRIINAEDWLGHDETLAKNDETLANLFNSFGMVSQFRTKNILFCTLRRDLRAYRRTFWHKWKVYMKRNFMSKKKLPG